MGQAFLRNLTELGRYAARQILTVRPRRRAFDRRQAAFLYRTDDGWSFELFPGEYIDGMIYADQIFERRALHRLTRRLGVGRTMLDVGANIGNHAIYLSRYFGTVHCFEPNPPIFERLERNIALNGLRHVQLHPVGLGRAAATLPFKPNTSGNAGSSRFSSDAVCAPVSLPVHQGDAYLRAHDVQNVDFIKIDVEGFELEVIEGLAGTIARDRPLLMIEYNGHEYPSDAAERLRALLPGYFFAEAIRTSGTAQLFKKVAFALREGMEPELLPLSGPASRCYDPLLAFPSAQAMNRFTSSHALG